jgi:hypothetical protein
MGPNQYYYLNIINFLTTILQKTKSNNIKLDGKDSFILTNIKSYSAIILEMLMKYRAHAQINLDFNKEPYYHLDYYIFIESTGMRHTQIISADTKASK